MICVLLVIIVIFRFIYIINITSYPDCRQCYTRRGSLRSLVVVCICTMTVASLDKHTSLLPQRIILHTYHIISYIITYIRRHIITYTHRHNITITHQTAAASTVPGKPEPFTESHRKVETSRQESESEGGPGKMKRNSVYVWGNENTYIAP